MQIRIVVAVVFATTAVCAGTAFGGPQSAGLGSAPKLIHAGHDNIVVDPALRRFAGMVTGLGSPDTEGRIYSFKLKPLGPAAVAPTSNEMRGWRLTILAGQRFSSVFEVQANTESEITVISRDGPLNGLAVNDVFIIEGYPGNAVQPVQQAAPATGS
jgi:hypothetical protein